MSARRALMSLASAAIGIVVVYSVAERTRAPGPRAEDLVGTWQVMTSRNLETGVVDSVAEHTLAWITYTPTHMAFTYMEKERPGGVAPSEFARLSPAERAGVMHSWVWDSTNVQLFGALAASWHLTGDTLFYESEMRINPYRVGQQFWETLVRVDDSTLVVRTRAEVTGEAREEMSRRVR